MIRNLEAAGEETCTASNCRRPGVYPASAGAAACRIAPGHNTDTGHACYRQLSAFDLGPRCGCEVRDLVARDNKKPQGSVLILNLTGGT